MQKRLHAIVFGLVQGVGYRYFVWTRAEQFGLSGFVKNLEDGCVEVVAEGEEKKLEEFLQLLRHGFGSARIKKISENWLDATGEFSSFRISY